MTPQPVGAPAYSPLPERTVQPAGHPRGKFAADLRAALSPQEERALEAVFGTEPAQLPKPPAAPVVALGRHIDVRA
jgi:hypothetical protein